MTKYKVIFDQNIDRVKSLQELYKSLKEKKYPDNKEYKLTDILRSAVVLLHSSFEEYFRNILIEWLPKKADSETLKQIPIALKAGKRNEKIYLNDLANYRDKQINDVIIDSVSESMKLESFNNQGDIISNLKKIGIDIELKQEFCDIDKAVNRRHKIVHEADFDKESNKLFQISAIQLEKWIEAYKCVVNKIDEIIESWT